MGDSDQSTTPTAASVTRDEVLLAVTAVLCALAFWRRWHVTSGRRWG